MADAERKQRWAQAHPERVKAAKEAYRLRNPVRIKEAKRRWRRRNLEKDRLAKQRYAEEERSRAAKRRWKKAHPEAGQMHAQRRRARQKQVFVEDVIPKRLFERDEGICQLCQKSIDDRFEVDHIVPIALGGEHSYANTQITHPQCNRDKGAKFLSELEATSV